MYRIINENEPIYPIRVAAKRLNISVHTLRMYEKEGLIIPFKKESKHRLYSEADLKRIQCIRDTINQDKVSIDGIKRILALVPCWSIIKCSEDDRKNCLALKESLNPCWTLKHRNNACTNRNCRECEVYMNFSNCHQLKDIIVKLTLKETT